MIGYVMVGTNDLDKAINFYDEVLKILDLERKDTDEFCAGYTQKGAFERIYSTLAHVNFNITGVVMNAMAESYHSYGTGYYYNHYHNYYKSDKK